jgi:acetylornithine deacetylase/succinyl-diaminopimelate desuccinylase-like protein
MARGSMTSQDTVKADAIAWIERTRGGLTNFLSEYVQHKSINPTRALNFEVGGTTDCQRWLKDYLSSLTCFERVELLKAGLEDFNIVASMRSSSSGTHRSIMFNGHSDVVPVTEQEYREWIGGNPWSGHTQDGYLYGRGASDMKGGNTAVIWAMQALAESGFVPPGQVTATFIVGEESGEVDIGPLNILRNGYTADIAIVTEPTNLEVCPAAVGWFFFRLDVLGQAAHAAGRLRSIYPSGGGVIGLNAIEIMERVMSRLRDLERQWGLYEKHPLMEPGTMAMDPVQISGGSYQATTPDVCSAVWAVTLSPNRTCTDVLDEIKRVIDSVTIGDRWLTDNPPIVTFPYLHTAYEPINISSEHLACKTLLKSATDVIGTRCAFSLMKTPSDANVFHAAGQPTMICGPGQLIGSGVHGLNERIEIEAVVQAAKTFAGMIVDWCSQEK